MKKVIQYSLLIAACFSFGQRMDHLSAQGEIVSGNVQTKIQSFYIGDEGGAYYVTVDGNKLYWVAEHPGQQYCHVGSGVITDGLAKCEWTSTPKYKNNSKGTVEFEIENNGYLLKVAKRTGNFPAFQLKAADLKQGIVDILPGPKKGVYGSAVAGEIEGVWIGASFIPPLAPGIPDPRRHTLYIRQEGSSVFIFGEANFEKGKLPNNAFGFAGARYTGQAKNAKGRTIKGSLFYLSKSTHKIQVKPYSFVLQDDRKMSVGNNQPVDLTLPTRWVQTPPPQVARDVDEYLSGLQYNLNALMAVQGDGTLGVKVSETGDATTTRTDADDATIVCQEQKHNIKNNIDEFLILDANGSAIYPGALFAINRNLVNGRPDLVTSLPRGPLNFQIRELSGFRDNKHKFKVNNPTNANIQGGLNEGLDWWYRNNNGGINAGNAYKLSTVAYSSEQAMTELGINYHSVSGNASAFFRHASNSEETVVYVLFRQVFYKVAVDNPEKLSDWFDEWVTVNQVKQQFTAAKPPTYVAEVSYGVTYALQFRSTAKVNRTHIEAAAKFIVGDGLLTADLEGDYEKIRRNITISSLVLGGNPINTASIASANSLNEARAAFNRAIEKNARFSKSNPGVVIGYVIRALKNNALVKAGFSAGYTETNCEIKPLQYVKFDHNGAYIAEFNVYWDINGVAQDPWSSGRKTAGWNYQLNLPSNAENIRVRGRARTGLTWQEWNTIFDERPSHPCRCRFKAKGTTLNTGKDIDCE